MSTVARILLSQFSENPPHPIPTSISDQIPRPSPSPQLISGQPERSSARILLTLFSKNPLLPLIFGNFPSTGPSGTILAAYLTPVLLTFQLLRCAILLPISGLYVCSSLQLVNSYVASFRFQYRGHFLRESSSNTPCCTFSMYTGHKTFITVMTSFHFLFCLFFFLTRTSSSIM